MNRDDGFGIFTTLTAARIQTLIIEIYDELLIAKLKGKPAKYGHWKRAVLAKNVDKTAILPAYWLFSEVTGYLVISICFV